MLIFKYKIIKKYATRRAVQLYRPIFAFVLLSLLRGEGASKSLLEILTLKPGSKLFRTELTCDFATCCQVLPRILAYHVIIYTCLLLHYLVFTPQLSTPLVAKPYVIYTPPINIREY
jgi:hypothetical protein